MKKYLSIMLCGLLLLTGCNKIPKLENGQEIVVEIDGKQFTAEELYEKLKESNGSSILINMVDQYITEKELTDEMRTLADTQAQSEFSQYKAYYSSNWSDFLSYYGFNTEQELLDSIIKNYQQALILEKYVKDEVITEKDIEAYYKSDIYGEITARHILVIPETTDSMTDDEKKAAKELALNKAKGYIEELKNSSNLEEDFIALAKEKSNDTGSASEGGLISNFTNLSGLAEEFWEESLKLKVGEYSSTPIETQFGYHIIYKVSEKDKPSLEDVKDTVIDNLVNDLLSADNASYVYWAGLREKYGMVIHDDIIKSDYNVSLSNLKKS